MAKEDRAISYEQARDELQQVVTKLEGQNVSLEEWLSGARKKLDAAQKQREAK
jgi:exonuclease VII small subunit